MLQADRASAGIPAIFYPLLPYRSFFAPFLLVTAVAVPCWVIARLYRHRLRGRPLSWRREILLLVFVVYLSGLAAATLSPSHPSRAVAEASKAIELRPDVTSLTCSSATLPSDSRAYGFCLRNARGNVALFFPLGILLPLVWPRLRFWRGVEIALALSVSIELLQLVSRALGSYRTADVNDVILNVIGAGLGLGLGLLLQHRSARTSQMSVIPQERA